MRALLDQVNPSGAKLKGKGSEESRPDSFLGVIPPSVNSMSASLNEDCQYGGHSILVKHHVLGEHSASVDSLMAALREYKSSAL